MFCQVREYFAERGQAKAKEWRQIRAVHIVNFSVQYACGGICRYFFACGWRCCVSVPASCVDEHGNANVDGDRVLFSIRFFVKCGCFEPRRYAGARRLFNIMANYKQMPKGGLVNQDVFS